MASSKRPSLKKLNPLSARKYNPRSTIPIVTDTTIVMPSSAPSVIPSSTTPSSTMPSSTMPSSVMPSSTMPSTISWEEMSFKEQSEYIFPISLITSWYNQLKETNIELKKECFQLVQGLLMVFLRRFMRLSSVACEYNQLTKPCIETLLQHIGWPKEIVKEALIFMTKQSFSSPELDQAINAYLTAHEWVNLTPTNYISNLIAWLINIFLVESIPKSFGKRKSITEEMLLNAWASSTSTDIQSIINDCLI